MFKELKKQFYLRWDEFAFMLALEAGLFLFGELMMAFSVYGLKDHSSVFPLGTLLALMIPAMLMIFFGMSSLPIYFNLVISMGTTRRRLLPALFAFSILENLLCAWIVNLFCLLENWIFRTAYAGIESELDLSFVFQWKYIFTICMVVVALNTLMGALCLKYGKKVFTLFWFLFMAVFIGGTRISKLLEHGSDHLFIRICRKALELFCGFSESGIIIFVIFISMGLMAAAYRILCRQQVEF